MENVSQIFLFRQCVKANVNVDRSGHRIVAFKPELVPIVGGISAALLLSQLLYWACSKKATERGGWFYKTVAELQAETGLTKAEQRTARKTLVRLGIIEAERRGIPPVYFYRVNFDILESLLSSESIIDNPQSSKVNGDDDSENQCSTQLPVNGKEGEPTKVHEVHDINKESKTTTKINNKRPKQAKQTPEQMLLFRDITGRLPAREQNQQVINAIGTKTLSDLKPYWDEWVKRGYRPTNITWLTDWAVQGMIPGWGNKPNTSSPSSRPIPPNDPDEVLQRYYELNPHLQGAIIKEEVENETHKPS